MVVILIIIGIIVISFGLYTILPYFTNTVVDEPLPPASGLNLRVVDFHIFLNLNG
jgi:multisubunit Na+/H+ antiporter MnhB subunit